MDDFLETIVIEEFTMDRYSDVRSAWEATPGIGLSRADNPEAVAAYLERNPGGSLTVLNRDDGRVIGGVLAGHDGRRGYIHHLFVLPGYRGQGIGRLLAERTIDYFLSAGIEKSHLFIFCSNEAGRQFWNRLGWKERHDIAVWSREHSADERAAITLSGAEAGTEQRDR